uniref:Uncharacterized protein n=1 Tax=Anguilla anguilla TaxID=7936 RepID=A0A0E9PUY0_ANGAN
MLTIKGAFLCHSGLQTVSNVQFLG